MSKIVAVRKNEEGTMTNFKLDDGREMSFEECYSAVNRGEIQGVIAGSTGSVNTIHAVRDNSEANNLSNLPTF